MDKLADWLADNPTAYIIIVIGGIFLSMFLMSMVQSKFKGTFLKYSQVTSNSGLTGGEIAKKILTDNGINYVTVARGSKPFTDHFNPLKNVIILSPTNYDSTSVAAISVAAHEVGHAIQWDKNWIGIRIRNFFLVPAQLGSKFGWIAFFIGLITMGMGTFGGWLLITGFVLIAMVTVFQFVTLPVEFDASSRALKILSTDGYLKEGSEEMAGAKKVLKAAAWTYVIGLVVSLLELFRLFVIMLMSSRR